MEAVFRALYSVGEDSDRIFNFLKLALRGLKVRIDMSQEDTLKLLNEFIKEVGLEEMVPNGADLADFVGTQLSEDGVNFSGMLDELPLMQPMVDAIKEKCAGDFTVGFVAKAGCIKVSFKTKGLKQFYDLVGEGLY